MKNIYSILKNLRALFALTMLLLTATGSFAGNTDSTANEHPNVAMNGIYTVNPAAAASATNFVRIGQADTAMMSNGIDGPVTIQIYNGTYGQAGVNLGTVAGSSATNTITFTSFSNDSVQVQILSTLSFLGTSNIILKKLNLSNVIIDATVDNYTFTNNQILNLSYKGGNNLTFINNYIKPQTAFNNLTPPLPAITISSKSGAQLTGIVVENNTFRNVTYKNNAGVGTTGVPNAINFSQVSRPTVRNNIFRNVNMVNIGYGLIGCCTYTTYPTGCTFQFDRCTDTAYIENNRFDSLTTDRLINDIDVSNQNNAGPRLSSIVIRNNFITVNGTFSVSPYSPGAASTQFYYNNINVVGGSGPVFDASTSQMKNNIFSSVTGAVVFTFSSHPGNADYNDFYTSGPVLAINTAPTTPVSYATFAQYKAGSGSNANGKNANPKYIDAVNLHVLHPALLAAGTPFPAVNPLLFDIDNDNRNQLNPCIGADEFQVPSTDAVAKQFLGAKKDFTSVAPQQLSLKVLNNGGAPLNQLKIRWSINGVEQLPPYTWAGNLAYDSTENISFGSYQFDPMKYTSLKIWTDLPNGVPDMAPVNDTLRIDSIMPFARGTFTIGGTAPSLPGFVKASEYLSYGGVDSAVVISVRDGKYTEQPIVKFARGTSLANTITFKGENNMAVLDTLSFTGLGTGTVPYATMKLDSAAFVTFRNMTFQSLNTGYAGEVDMSNKSRFITFDSCVFYAASATGGVAHVATGTPVSDSNFVFTNSIFRNGYNGGIKLNAKNIFVKGNRFEGINSGNAIDISGAANDGFITIDSNYVKNPQICTFTFNNVCYIYGINQIGGINIASSGTNNNINIRKNKIYTTSRAAVTITTSGSAAMPVRIYNNFFEATNNNIFRSTGAYTDIAHNNFADSTNNSANAIEITGLNTSFRNNIIAHSTPGSSASGYYLINLSSAAVAASLTSNYNAYYYSDTAKTFYNGSAAASLSQWQAATGKDLNSRRTANAFVLTAGDLHIDKNKPGAVDVFATGTPLATVPADIDDSTRSTTAPCIGADEFKLNDVDAGAVAITNLGFPVILGSNNVVASIRNFGSANLTSASVNWSVNGALQAPYAWSGNLLTGDSAVNLNIGSFNFATPGKYDVRVWTSNPNGSADINLLNDTAYKAVYPALCGTYTIGGAAPVFPTLTAAGAYLSLAGVTCPVLFNVRDGIYTESDTLNFVPGSSSVNTVTFQSESLDSSKVVFQQSDYTNANPYSVLRINDARYLKFRMLTFRRNPDPSFHYYFDVIILAGNTSGISFTNCDISTTGAGKLITANTVSASQDYNFSNNVFTGGMNGILLGNYTATPPLVNNLIIKDNKFKKPSTTTSSNSTYTIDVQYANAVNIENNFIDSCVAGYYIGGIQVQSNTGKITILKNTILKRKGINGINLQYITGGNTADSAVVIANNFVTIDSTRAAVGIYSSSTGRNVKMVYNNILANSANTSSRAIQFNSSYGTGTLKDTIANNNIINTAAGHAFYFSQGTTGDVNCSNNNIYVSGTAVLANYMGTNYTTLASLPTTGGTNTGNVSKNPLYLSSSNLHVGELSLRLDGKPLSYVTTDIDGDTRGLVTSTIGADEIVVSNFDIGVTALVAPAAPFAAGNQNINVAIKNYGSSTITSAVVNWSINGTLQAPFNFSGSIPFNTTANAVIANYNFVVDSAYNIKFWTSAPNGGTDAAVSNDSLYINNLYPALSGAYTIGGVTPSFRTFTGSSLNLKYGGMLGNVTFNARDGKYNETLLVDSIPFQNNYGVIWQSESNDSSKATLAYTTAANDNIAGVLQLNKTKNITIRKIGLQVKIPAANASATYQSLVYFSNRNKNAQLINNLLVDSTYFGPPSANNTGSIFIYNRDAAASGQTVNARSADSAVVIDGNYFKQVNVNTNPVIDLGGYTTNDYGGNTTIINYLNNLTISRNRYDLKLNSKQAVNITYADSVKLLSNTITGTVQLYGKDLIVMDRNDVYHEDVGKVAVTINSIANRAAGKPVIISNNMIKTVRVGNFNGVLLGNTALYVAGDRVNIIHNTFATSDSGSVTGYAPTACLYLAGTKLDTVKNNVFYNTSGGYLLYHNAVTTLISNNNDYVYSTHFSNNAASLAAYRAALGQDAQSVENINPYFRGPKDLHASNILLKAAPTPVPSNAYYATDVDGQARGAIACYGADEFAQPANDMVVLDASPKKVFPEGTNDIKIRVYNNGSNPITSFNATSSLTNYVDNGGTASLAGNLNYSFSGNIAPGTEATLTLGQMSIPLFRNILKVNTTGLNGIGDEINFDDSLVYDNYYAGLNGSYTFRDYPNNSAANFKSFQDAATQLKFGGVYGASALNMLPGIYNQYLYIDSIPNRGALSPLTIQSANGDSSTTGFASFVTATPSFTIYRANNVAIKNLFFGPNPSTGTSGTYQIALGYMSQNISVENCRIVNSTAALTTASASASDAVYVGGWQGQPAATDSNYIFKNNIIIGGLRALASAGGAGSFSRNFRITNNKLINQYNAAVEATLIRNIKIDSNTIQTNTANNAYRAISLISTLKLSDVQKNKINIIKDGFGIYNDDQNYGFLAVTDTLRITNNFITVGESSASAGIKITTINVGKQVQVLYNSINNRSSSAASSAYNCLTGQSGGKSEVINNIFFNKGNGIPVVLTKYAPVSYIHHNNALFTNGPAYGQVNSVNYNTLSALSATGVEYSSVSGDPLFVSDSDLHVDGALVNNTGSYDANVYTLTDIDNEARSASTPDIGADEFKLPNFGAVQLETPLSSCSHTAAETVKAWIKNFGTAPRTNVPVAYRINVGSIVRDTVRTIINAGDSVLFTFTQTANLAAPLDYYFDIWTDYRGDSLPSNDTLRQFLVATTPSNNVLPYYTGFEGTNAGWYTGGQNTSFKWGVVFSGVVDSAANGLNAWKTNLTGPHNNNENSYLYSPCFDLSAATTDPTLNFNMAYQLESNTDKAWIEYSSDGGASWTKLGAQGEGLAWYNNGGNYWTGMNKMWHNAKHTLPISGLGDRSRVRVRFVLQTNGSVVQDGLSVDDVSIYTGANPPVSAGTYTGRTAVSTGTATFIPVNDPSGNRLVEINDNGQSLGTITVDVNQNNGGIPTSYGGQTYLGRNWVIHVQAAPVAPVRVRLFLTQAEVDAWRSLDPSVDLMRNISLYKFSGNIEDFSLANNTSGTPLTISPAQLVKVPYLDGYFVEFSVSSFSEFWLTKAPGSVVVPVTFVDVKASLQNNKTSVTWKVESEVNVSHYNVLHSTDGLNFRSVGTVNYRAGNGIYSFIHNDPEVGRNYYRIQQADLDGRMKLSNVVNVVRKAGDKIDVYPTLFTNTFKVDNSSAKAGLIMLYAADGKLAMQSRLAAGMNIVDGSALAKGNYFYRIIIDNVQADSGKLIKE